MPVVKKLLAKNPTKPEWRRLKLCLTIEGEQGAGKSSVARLIQDALERHRRPYSVDTFRVAIFDNGKVPTMEQIKERITQDNSNVVVIVKQA